MSNKDMDASKLFILKVTEFLECFNPNQTTESI